MSQNVEGIISLISSIREKANEHIAKELAEKKLGGILPAHGRVLNQLLGKKSSVKLTDLVKVVGRAKSTITVTINKLAKEGYVMKEASADDNRSINIKPTIKLIEAEKKFREVNDSLLAKTYDGISDQEKKNLMEVLKKIEKNLS